MKYRIKYTSTFKKSYKLCKRRGYDMTKLKEAIAILECQGELPSYTDLIFFPADMKENGSVTLNPTGFLFGFRKTTR